ncbi:hypothetical protein BROUX41_005235 [Berkeleyomyces rouxiae]|uniref:uncharacterized protein n=1 Tax=Berkeleyomyces rouxiae TaxID=2035830 RepID=UPI003B7E337E
MSSSTYKQFLAAPNSSLLSGDATLHYITTTTTISGAENIIKHLNTVSKQVKKKTESVLDEVNGRGASVVQLETTIEFVTSGGPYAPGLDDNFLADRTISMPITHFVHYDSEGRIAQIRQQWDQGALLKDLDIIGKSGRNWPIPTHGDQLRLIANCVKSSDKAMPSSSYEERTSRPQRPRDNSTLSLFRAREDIENEAMPAVASPYAGNRPQQRSLHQIVGNESDSENEFDRSQSPSRRHLAKAGASKNVAANRVFSEEELPPSPPRQETGRPQSRVKPDPSKYNHFDFDDFNTPQKVVPSRGTRSLNARHWDNDPSEIPETPVGHGKSQPKPRRETEKHFEIEDDGPVVPRRNTRPRGTVSNETQGLYENHVYREDGSAPTPAPREMLRSDVAHRQKDFQTKYKMTDAAGENTPQTKRPLPSDRKKVLENMEPNWETADVSPVSTNKESIRVAGNGMGSRKNVSGAKTGDSGGIHIAGDGMGGPKGTNRDWLFGGAADDDEPEAPKPKPKRLNNRNQPSEHWDF